MNIFVLDKNPIGAAQAHNDKHVVKMILESAQMLCTVANELNIASPYKSTHKNHPCTVWARESRHNYMWLWTLMTALNDEWQYRYDHTRLHLSLEKLLEADFLLDVYEQLPDIPMTPFAQAMPEEYRQDDAVLAYQEYYRQDKAHLMSYTKREKPEWL